MYKKVLFLKEKFHYQIDDKLFFMQFSLALISLEGHSKKKWVWRALHRRLENLHSGDVCTKSMSKICFFLWIKALKASSAQYRWWFFVFATTRRLNKHLALLYDLLMIQFSPIIKISHTLHRVFIYSNDCEEEAKNHLIKKLCAIKCWNGNNN